eukprot:RCo047782
MAKDEARDAEGSDLRFTPHGMRLLYSAEDVPSGAPSQEREANSGAANEDGDDRHAEPEEGAVLSAHASRVVETVEIWCDHIVSLLETYRQELYTFFLRPTPTVERFLADARDPPTPLTSLKFWRKVVDSLAVVEDYGSHPQTTTAKLTLRLCHREDLEHRFEHLLRGAQACLAVAQDAVHGLSFLEPYCQVMVEAQSGCTPTLQAVIDAVPAVLTCFRMLW